MALPSFYIYRNLAGAVSKLHWNNWGNKIKAVTTVTDTYQMLVTDNLVVCNKATAFVCTLPVGVVGDTYKIKNIGAGNVTVSLSGDTIDGETSQIVYSGDCMNIECVALNEWRIV